MDESCFHNSRGKEDLAAVKETLALRGTSFPALTLADKGAWPEKSELPLTLEL